MRRKTERHDHSGQGHGGHAHGPGHIHAPASFDRAFAIGVGLNTLYVVLEATFGILSGSLALLADAGHNLSDVLGLLIAWGASWLARSAGPLWPHMRKLLMVIEVAMFA